MPAYTLECLTCTHIHNYIARHTAAVPECPGCGAPGRRVITSVPAMKLMGAGWSHDGYSTTERGMATESDKADSAADKRRMKNGKAFS